MALFNFSNRLCDSFLTHGELDIRAVTGYIQNLLAAQAFMINLSTMMQFLLHSAPAQELSFHKKQSDFHYLPWLTIIQGLSAQTRAVTRNT